MYNKNEAAASDNFKENSMRILMAASEAFPFFKTGGLGDVTGALSRVFARDPDNEVVLFLPRYRDISCPAGLMPQPAPGKFFTPMGGGMEETTLEYSKWENVNVFFINSKRFFDRPGMYRSPSGDYWDNDERFAFFSRAVLEAARFLDFKPEVIHCHDWQTGLLPAYLYTFYGSDPFFNKTATVFTIHNLAYQGMFSKDSLHKIGFSWNEFTAEKLEFYGGLNYMKAALVYSDIITTVSPTYSEEIQYRGDLGHGLDGILRNRSADLSGILNGIDQTIWNPATDTKIFRNYDITSFEEGKKANKLELQKQLGLEINPDKILAGIVSRMDSQKGLDIVLHIAYEFMNKIQFVALGSGDPGLCEGFRHLVQNHRGCAAFSSDFDEPLAHKIYAASDLFLMPSRFEPCGLSQMIAMRYGALPVVTRTGGLKDTVFHNGIAEECNGYAIDDADDGQLRWMLQQAVKAFDAKKDFQTMIRNAMKGDYSWNHSAEEYLNLYRTAIEKHQN